MRIFVLGFVAVVLAFTAAADAHTVGLSRGTYKLEATDLNAELTFSRSELTAALPGLDADNDGSLLQTEVDAARNALDGSLVQGVSVSSPSGTCGSEFRDAVLTEEDGLIVKAAYHCPEKPQTVSVKLKFLDALSYGHRHLISATAGNSVFHGVAYAGNARFDLQSSLTSQSRNPLTETAWPLFRLGIQHILTGYDHLLFLIGLIIVSRRLRPLLLVVSAFTVAHSITLGLAALNIWAPSPTFVEPVIALTIAYVGVENWFVKDADRRWMITFPFGLIHGFGFAGALREISLPHGQIPLALAAFNIGVEAGQIAFLLVALPVILWARKQIWFANRDRGVKVTSTMIALAGGFWFVSRAGVETALITFLAIGTVLSVVLFLGRQNKKVLVPFR